MQKGDKVRFIDFTDSGTIMEVGDGFCMVELDGMVIKAFNSEFVVVDEREEESLANCYAGGNIHSAHSSCKTKAAANGKVASSEKAAANRELVVDLHLEKLPGGRSIPPQEALALQLKWFRKVMLENKGHSHKRIVFIHGDGNGILKEALRRELEERFSRWCTYSYGTAIKYGTGATSVTIK